MFLLWIKVHFTYVIFLPIFLLVNFVNFLLLCPAAFVVYLNLSSSHLKCSNVTMHPHFFVNFFSGVERHHCTSQPILSLMLTDILHRKSIFLGSQVICLTHPQDTGLRLGFKSWKICQFLDLGLWLKSCYQSRHLIGWFWQISFYLDHTLPGWQGKIFYNLRVPAK